MALEGRDRDLLERAVVALEKLNEDPVVQIEGGPPICPHCNTMAPVVAIEMNEGEGPLSEFLIMPICKSCDNMFFAVPLEWAIFESYEESVAELKNRREVFSNGNGS